MSLAHCVPCCAGERRSAALERGAPPVPAMTPCPTRFPGAAARARDARLRLQNMSDKVCRVLREDAPLSSGCTGCERSAARRRSRRVWAESTGCAASGLKPSGAPGMMYQACVSSEERQKRARNAVRGRDRRRRRSTDNPDAQRTHAGAVAGSRTRSTAPGLSGVRTWSNARLFCVPDARPRSVGPGSCWEDSSTRGRIWDGRRSGLRPSSVGPCCRKVAAHAPSRTAPS